MKAYQKLGIVFSLVISGSASADILYDNIPLNLNPAELGGLTIYSTNSYIANKFSGGPSCASGCTLGDVTAVLYSDTGTTAGFQLQVVADNAGSPGDALVTLTTGQFGTSFQKNVFTPNASLQIFEGDYWVKLSTLPSIAQTGTWGYRAGDTQTAPSQPAENFYSLDFGYGFPIEGSISQSLMMTVEATPLATPIPGTVWMMGSALLGFITTRYRKSKI